MRAVLGMAVALCASAALAHGPLPLGDGQISTGPQAGKVFACTRHFGGGGAHRIGGWIRQGRWYPDEKPMVEGEVAWSDAKITITVDGQTRVIRANGLPTHSTGRFPIRPGSTAHSYDRNPNRLQPQDVLLRLPAEPRLAATPGCVPMGPIGIAITGAWIFNAFDAMGRDAPAYEILDRCNGHPERGGRYHYHDWSPCLAPADHPVDAPVGWMLDGFPILGPVEADGRSITNADLDACHGRVGPVRIDGRMVEMYHYRFTREYPYTVGCFRGGR